MSEARALLAALRGRGVQLWTNEGRIRYRPEDALAAEDIAFLREHKAEVIGLLEQGNAAKPHGPRPLSAAQESLWFLEQLGGHGPAYNIVSGFRLAGRLDETALRRAFDELVRRHEILRTRFGSVEGTPVQLVAPVAPARFHRVDLSSADPATRRRRVGELVDRELARRFDLEQENAFVVSLLRLAPEEHLLVVNVHHILYDATSDSVFFDELDRLYRAFEAGAASPLPEPTWQFGDYAEWERRWSRSDEFRGQLRYWRERLAGAPAGLELPLDRPRPLTPDHTGDVVALTLGGRLADSVRELAKERGATPFMVLLAAYHALLWSSTRQRDISVGVAIDGRGHPDADALIGYFLAVLPIRAEISAGAGFADLLETIRERVIEAYDNRNVPLARLVAELRPAREPGRQPFFQTLFSYLGGGATRLGDLTLEPVDLPGRSAKFDLSLFVAETAGGFDASFEYATAVFDRATVERLAGRFERLLEGAVAAPRLPLARQPLLSDAERRLLTGWNATGAPVRDVTLTTLIAERISLHPGRTAVVTDGTALTYAELDHRSTQAAHHLLAHGVAADRVVGVHFGRSIELVVAVLGVLKAGGAYLPLDPELPPERIRFMVTDTAAAVVLTDQAGRAQLPALPGTAVLAIEDRTAPAPAAALPVRVHPENLAYVIYTSGSTGRPKGVANTHRGIVNRLSWMQGAYALGADDVVLHKTPIGFDVSVWELFWPLVSGARLVLAAPGGHRDPHYLAEVLRQHRVTTVHFVPSMLRAFLDAEVVPGASVRRILCSGEELPRQLVTDLLAVFAGELHNLYGPTEAAIDVSSHPCTAGEAGRVPIGRPIWNTRLHVLDENLEPVPIGVPGELYLGGVQLARGYLGRPDLTAERFVPDPFAAAGERLYRSGDIAKVRPDGAIVYLGRIDDQVKIRGHRVEPGEVAQVLRDFPEVTDAVVVAREDRPGDPRLVAYLTGGRLEPAELRDWASSRLPAPLVPSAYVAVDFLPVTANGKLDRRALPAPGAADLPSGAGAVAPVTAVETTLAGIVAEVLGLPRVGTQEDFFALGGHSLLVTQVIARVRRDLGVDVPVGAFYAGPTVAGLAGLVTREVPGAESELVRADRDGPLKASFAQERMWLADQLSAAPGTHTVSAAWQLTGALDVPALEGAVREVVRRHENLRTAFRAIGGELFLEIAEPPDSASRFTDLASAGGTPEDARRLLAEDDETPFRLDSGPLLRAHVVRLGPREHFFGITVHHTVADHWSFGVLLAELSAAYTALAEGKAPSLPALPAQYADYAAWQRELLTEEVLAGHLAYWTDYLAGASPETGLSAARRRPAHPAHAAGAVDFEIPAVSADRLRALGRDLGATPFEVLLTAFAVLLHRIGGQDDLCLGYFSANRERVEFEGLIGYFVNTLVLRSRIGPGTGFADALADVAASVRAMEEHRALPFQHVVERLRAGHDTERHPIFDVAFNYLRETGESGLRLPGVDAGPLALDRTRTQFALTLAILDRGSGRPMGATFEYDTEVFDRATAERFAAQLVTLTASVSGAPRVPVRELPFGTPAAGRTAGREPVRTTTIPAEFEAWAARVPDAVAVTGPAGALAPGTLTYRELNARANQLGRYLLDRGAGAERIVALVVERTVDLVVAVLATLKTGAAYLPINPDDPPARIADLLADADPVHVLASADVPLPDERVTRLGTGLPAVLDGIEAAGLPTGPEPGNAAYVIYTSGSTGRPKGVVVPHQNVIRLLDQTDPWFGFGPADTGVLFHSYTFDFSVWELWSMLLKGGRLVVVPHSTSRAPGEFLRLLRSERVTVLNQTPTAFYQLMKAEQARRQDDRPLVLRSVVFGGEALDASRLADWYAGHPERSPLLVNMYGITETTVHVTYFELDRQCATGTAGSVIGTAIPDLELSVLDDHLRPVPPGAVGELHISGAGLARGYLGQPELTAERFVPDPLGGPGARMYRSGDLARIRPEGTVEYLGRIDDQVKIRGHRVELGEIEQVLRDCPQVTDAVVTVREDRPDDQRLVAYLTGRAEPRSALAEWARARLPRYMVPSAYVFVEEFPLTVNGKLDRRALPAPGVADLPPGIGFVAPATAAERALARFWADVLGVPVVGRHDNFFEIGGHSLLATRILALVRDRWGTELPLRDFYKHPTVAELAGFVAGGAAGEERVVGVL
ncbi:amino acid adenylation domain-containing protein [Amycolatopsis sp. lyj-23]|uniref:amino acid adenylation domain-containing protein n=1 Tax=Amycolatopsis sp. lyj-23 TaxID=2789283 RepID=UPI00397C9F13